jgi:hypothetical protein
MGRKTIAAAASVAVLAAGGAVAGQARAAANPANASVDGVVSSYFGPLGLRDDFQHFMQAAGYNNFAKWMAADPAGASAAIATFSFLHNVAPPPGFDNGGGNPGL